MNSFDSIAQFEQQLADYTGAPYVVMTDCCTHAIELCLRYQKVSECEFTAFTYLSIPMTMHKLGINYQLTDESWSDEYQLHHTNIWDSARLLAKNMYRSGQMQCLSFGYSKPLEIGGGGAILLDDPAAHSVLLEQRYDGRNLAIAPWSNQHLFRVGYHYRPTIEQAELGSRLLEQYQPAHTLHKYSDLRKIKIQG